MRITPVTHMAIFPYLLIAKDLLKCKEITKLFKDRQQLSRCNSHFMVSLENYYNFNIL